LCCCQRDDASLTIERLYAGQALQTNPAPAAKRTMADATSRLTMLQTFAQRSQTMPVQNLQRAMM
jgi:hypothetical protein